MTVEIFILSVVGLMLLLLGSGVAYVNIRDFFAAREKKNEES